MFLKIDKEYTLRFIHLYLRKQEHRLLEKLDSDHALQIELIEQLLATESLWITDRTKLIYIERLCQYRPKMVISELQKREYPTEDTILICTKYKNQQGLTYLYQKEGSFTKALFAQIEIFKEQFRKCLAKLRKKPQSGKSRCSSCTQI